MNEELINNETDSSVELSSNYNNLGKHKRDTSILNKGGRPKAAIWNNFNQGNSDKNGHYSAICHYCNQKWQRGKPAAMEAHLALRCKGNIPDDIKKHWLIEVAKRGEKSSTNNDDDDDLPTSSTTKKSKTSRQQSMDNHFKSIRPVTLQHSQDITKALLKAFVCCGIPFAIIDNPFFRDLLQLLEPGYTPPHRDTLSNKCLDEEIARITVKMDTQLSKSENLTLGKFIILIITISNI